MYRVKCSIPLVGYSMDERQDVQSSMEEEIESCFRLPFWAVPEIDRKSIGVWAFSVNSMDDLDVGALVENFRVKITKIEEH